ncbi:hypothetical protein TKWG_06485 [Advenella kashmirensis WT001]|uniref:Uncharacterized protein n=1 Tax=Advenella kashmirensis (strain DSM 17095 / LMG 22695 / WT001) TaxID=1036672 RepID=I3U9Q2_ADVKW|nr:hypothetical protein TKWG_06485 [Advenella kashmirensis WT001]
MRHVDLIAVCEAVSHQRHNSDKTRHKQACFRINPDLFIIYYLLFIIYYLFFRYTPKHWRFGGTHHIACNHATNIYSRAARWETPIGGCSSLMIKKKCHADLVGWAWQTSQDPIQVS